MEDNPYSDLDEFELKTKIEETKQEFIERDIEKSQARMLFLAKDLATLNRELASRQDEDQATDQYQESASRWEKLGELVKNGEDPTEEIQSGSEEPQGDTNPDVSEFRVDIPDISFDKIGGYAEVKEELLERGLKPTLYSEFIQDELGRTGVNGVVLSGPPGTGKTMMLKAFAARYDEAIEEDLALFKVKPAQLKRGIRGESGDYLRSLFDAARAEQPSVIIFEEIDTLIQARETNSVQMTKADRDLGSAFLDEVTEIDEDDIICLGTTNLSDALDKAATRPNRLEEISMGLPEAEARAEILKIHVKSVDSQYRQLTPSDIKELVGLTEGFSGARIFACVDDAIRRMAIEYIENDRTEPVVTKQDIRESIRKYADVAL